MITGRKITLSAAREASGYTQKEIAGKLNIKTATLRSWERYKTSPNIKYAYDLCQLYGCPFEFIQWNKQPEPEEITLSVGVICAYASLLGMSVDDFVSAIGA